MTNYFKHKMRRKSAGEIVGWIILGIVAVVAFGILFGYVIMWLWNWLMPALFGLQVINFWQALGIFILAKFLFGGFGGGGGKKSASKNQGGRKCDPRSKGEFSKWKFYDRFWEDEGKNAFEEYVSRQQNKGSDEEVNTNPQ